jgi:hypothetical protein
LFFGFHDFWANTRESWRVPLAAKSGRALPRRVKACLISTAGREQSTTTGTLLMTTSVHSTANTRLFLTRALYCFRRRRLTAYCHRRDIFCKARCSR